MQWTEKRNLFLPLLVGGIFAGVFLGTIIPPVFALLLCSSVSLVLLVTATVFRKRNSFVVLALVLVSLASVLGSARAWIFTETIPSDLVVFEGQSVSLIGKVVTDPDERETSTRLTVFVQEVNGIISSGKILVTTHRYLDVSYGDVVHVQGILEKPESFETDTGRTFNYPKYLSAHRITHGLFFADVEVIEHGKGNIVLAALLGLKNRLVGRIDELLPDPEAPLLAGLLLGEKQSLGEDLYASFQRAGVVHMIVLSGYNVSLVVQALLKSTEMFLPRNLSFITAGFGIIAFALMTGATETTIRASVMAGILILASVLRRPYSALRALLMAGALMVLINPYLLLYDVSFQLSFLATAGIILFSDSIAKRLTFLPNFLGLREIGGATLAAQLAVLPILIISIGNVSVVSPFANMLVLAAVPWAMLFGFVASMLGFVGVWLALPFSTIAYGLLNYILNISVWFGDLPFASLTVPPAWIAVGSSAVFIIYAGALFIVRKRSVLKLPPRSSS